MTQELGTLPEFETAMDEATYSASRIPRFLRQIALLMQVIARIARVAHPLLVRTSCG